MSCENEDKNEKINTKKHAINEGIFLPKRSDICPENNEPIIFIIVFFYY